MDRTSRLMLTRLMLSVFLLLSFANAFAGAREIRGFSLTVSKLDDAVAFYEQALGFKKTGERLIVDQNYDSLNGVFGARVRVATLQLGEEFIELEQYVAAAGERIPTDSRSNDLWFQHFAVVVSDMQKAYDHLQKFSVMSISSAPQTIPQSNRAAAGIQAYKFKDPDGHPLELLWFPEGKGKPKWHGVNAPLFMGIDHSAIGISDTVKSTAFYRDLIGLKVAGGSINSGITQEQLDNAFGAVVRITGLQPENVTGPGLEFLQYLTPSGGRAAPTTLRPNDLVTTRTVIEIDDLDVLARTLQERNVAFVSPQPLTISGAPWRKALLVKDPDGHAVLLVER